MLRGTKRKVWVGRWREYVTDPATLKDHAINRKEVLGTLADLPTKKLALRELEGKISHLNRLDYRPTSVILFKDFAERWKKTILIQHKPSTQEGVIGHINSRLLPNFGEIMLRDINTERLQRYVGSLDVAPKTIRNIMASFRMIWKTARAWGYVHHDPFGGLMYPKNTPKEKQIFTVEEVQQIINAAREPHKTMYWILAETGMRIGELCALRVGDLSVEKQLLQVCQSAWCGNISTPKTNAGRREFAISSGLAEAITKHTEGLAPDTLIFRTRNNTPFVGKELLRRFFHPLTKSLGLPQLGFHSFRHANATWMDEEDVPLKTRQVRLGHANPDMTIGVYTHRSTSADRLIAEKLGSILRPNCGQVPEAESQDVDSTTVKTEELVAA